MSSLVQMELWDGAVLDINVTVLRCSVTLGQKYLQLPAINLHALSDCDTISYPYGKGNVTALNTMLSGDYLGLETYWRNWHNATTVKEGGDAFLQHPIV